MTCRRRDCVNVIRVASVPAGHPYITAVVDPALLTLLADPVPPGARRPEQWWPPQWLDPGYLRSHVDEIDVMHVHFGFEGVTHGALIDVTDILAAQRIPLVVTVHDLANPHLEDQAGYVDKLGTLVCRADAVTTLTQGAARQVTERWGVRPTVLPHPHLLPIEHVGARRAHRSRPVVAVHAKYLRANLDPWPVLDALVADRSLAQHVSLRLDLDDNALRSPRADAQLPDRLATYRADGVDVRIHPPFTDAELIDYLRHVDVMVLPYRFGTHSGWVEACYDSGVMPVVPDCGHFHEQQACPTFGFDRGRLDTAGLLDAVAQAVTTVTTQPGGDDVERRQRRARQRAEVRLATAALYRNLCDAATAA
jgi:glycosyltransferase involved in cell wall biosynthesis